MKEILLQAIQESGALILKHFGTSFAIYQKTGINNLVTEIDQASEQLIRKIINQAFPEHGIVGEEYEIQETKTK